MRGSKSLGVALALAMPLAAVGYLVWVYYSAGAQLDRRSQSGTGDDSAEPWFESDPVDPADLHGTWTSWAEAGTNRRESVLDFRPDGHLVWTTRVTVVRDGPTIEVTERHDYRFEHGRFLRTTVTERSLDGKTTTLRDADRLPKLWKLDWRADDKSVFQLRTDPRDEGRPHLLFRKSPAGDAKKG
jgi:hypothetical protein